VKIEHAAALHATPATLPDGQGAQPRYPAKTKPGMICVLAYQVKMKNAGIYCKSV